jgi:hypothetical protein
MVYSLTAVSLNKKQLSTIQKHATSRFTQLCGFEKTFPKAVVHGPVAYGGLGFPYLYAKSNIGKIETIICHINKGTTLGSSLCMNINWLQLHSGRSKPILECKDSINYVQDNWFMEIKKFLNTCNATIKINSLWVTTLSQHNDQFIMDASGLDTSNKNTCVIINNWRLYFQVNTISDITNHSGRQILSVFLEKKKLKAINQLQN